MVYYILYIIYYIIYIYYIRLEVIHIWVIQLVYHAPQKPVEFSELLMFLPHPVLQVSVDIILYHYWCPYLHLLPHLMKYYLLPVTPAKHPYYFLLPPEPLPHLTKAINCQCKSSSSGDTGRISRLSIREENLPPLIWPPHSYPP